MLFPLAAHAQASLLRNEKPASQAAAAAYSPALHDQAIQRWRAGTLPLADLLSWLAQWRGQVSDAGARQRIVSDQVAVAAQASSPFEALAYAQSVPPATLLPYAFKAQVSALSRAGSPQAALQAAQTQSSLFNPLEMAELRQAALGERLRWAVSERDMRLLDAARYAALDAVIAEGNALAAEWARATPGADSAAWQAVSRRLAADRVVARFERGRPQEALTLYAELLARHGDAPYYAKAAAAGAHAQLRQPGQAVPLYEAALREGGSAVRVPSDIHVGLVYAYLDTARFTEADALLDGMLARTPPLLSLSPERGRPNNDYGDLLGLRALVHLYTDRPALAERGFNQLSSLAPLNPAYRTGQARTLRARQHPEAAAAAFEALLTDHPQSIEAQAAYAETLFDLGELGAARQRVDALASGQPQHAAVRSAVRTRDTVMAPRLEIDAASGRDGGTLSKRDAFLNARLSSRWFDDQWRLFFHQWLGRADLGAPLGDSDRGRGGLGLQWRKGAWDAQGEVHQSSGGLRKSGMALALNWRASDSWRLGARWDSNTTDIPWRARQAGVAARQAQADAAYIVNESRRFDAQWQQRDYTDGNQRRSAGASWRERWVSGPRFQLETTLAADTARNRSQAVAYFSPARESALQLNVRGQWLNWKSDDRTFLQALEAGAGRYREGGFGASATQQLRYSHEWNWGAGWQLRYGLGAGVHPYGGVRERRRELFVHFTMPFL